jgi:hypothetical protein
LREPFSEIRSAGASGVGPSAAAPAASALGSAAASVTAKFAVGRSHAASSDTTARGKRFDPAVLNATFCYHQAKGTSR